MAITGKLRWDEETLELENQGARTELRYILESDDPENEDREQAMAWLLDDTEPHNVPRTLYGLRWNRLSVKEIIRVENDVVNTRLWDAVVEYVLPESKKPKPLEVDLEKEPEEKQTTRFSVRSSGGRTMRRLFSRRCVQELDVSDGEFLFGIQKGDPGRLLNLKSDDSDDSTAMFTGQGIDVPLGTVEIVVETVRLNENVQTDGFVVQAAEYAAKNVINSEPYYGFPKNSLKLVNFTSSQRGGEAGATPDNDQPWDVTYTFEYAPQTHVLLVDYPPEFANKPFSIPAQQDYLYGWQYLDTLYVNDEVGTLYVDDNGDSLKLVIPKAVRMALHDIYEEIDFITKLKI